MLDYNNLIILSTSLNQKEYQLIIQGFNNDVLSCGRKGSLEHTIRAKIRDSFNLGGAVAQATGQGLGSTTSPTVIILPSSAKQLKKDLTLIIASIHAGNDSDDMKNRGLAIIDELKTKGQMKTREEIQLQKFFLTTLK